ncbi:MAG TPA: Hsp20/alpha crystallin family protein [Anaerolineales bacterium]|nr:Hsp20/alpha crystallin family protein [Anaerolineales bacterium]
MSEEHVVPVRVEEHLEALTPEARGMPVNLYHTDQYLVINAGLPRCLPDRVRVSVAPGKMLIRAERHPGELIREERVYILSELPDGAVARMLDLPKGEWAYDAAEAHFANGLLTVTLPTPSRAEYLRQRHAT